MARTWETHELPVLQVIEEHEPVERMAVIIDALAGQLDQDEVEETARRLLRAGYIDAVDASGSADLELLEIRLEEKARVRLGQWPGDEIGEAFLALLRQQADTTTDEGERRRLDNAVSSLAAIGGQTLSGILTQLLMRGGM